MARGPYVCIAVAFTTFALLISSQDFVQTLISNNIDHELEDTKPRALASVTPATYN